MEDALSEKRKAFAAAHRSDKDCQGDITASSLSSPRLRLGRRHTCLSLLNLILNRSIIFSLMSLALRSHLHPLLTSPNVPLPGGRHQSTPTT